MNKFIKFMSVAVLAAMPVALASCSDDDDDNGNGGGNSGNNNGQPSVSEVMPEGLPNSIDGATFTTNASGQVTKITDGDETVTFEYGTFSRATTFNVLMKVRDNYDPEDDADVYMQTNNQGFVTYALEVYLDEEEGTDEWHFEYNADGQLTRLRRSESGDDFKITYTNGDITKVVQDDKYGDHSEYTFSYTNTNFTSAVANKGGIMLFDDFFHIDMDEMGIAYFAGLLGKSTKNLPMGYSSESTEGSSSYTHSETYNWLFNDNQLPTKFWEGNYEYDAVTFAW